VPVWHEKTREWLKQGRLVLVGVTQEQHPDRCRLFAQWQQFDWPILHDPINLLEAPAVPIIVAIDEHGIVRAVGPRPETLEAEFLDKEYLDDAPPGSRRLAGVPDPGILLESAKASPSSDSWRTAGDALTIWRGALQIDEAIDAYRRALLRDPTDNRALFRLGVAYRVRHDSERRHVGDFQAAIDAWERALALDPNQYIWRRRIEQYGPRLAKPYPFYDWVAQARTEISRRGGTPVHLVAEPYGSELASPVHEVIAEPTVPVEPDPMGRIHRDENELIETEVIVVPTRLRPGQAARVHVILRPNHLTAVHWNNESTPLRMWVNGAEGWTIDPHLLEADQPDQPESDEVRRLDFEIKAPTSAKGTARFSAYVLYNVCEQSGGRCLFLRQDLSIEIDIEK
jgi:hypothetical protein